MDNSFLVSCIMPTRGRAKLAQKALECWQSQTYPNRELLIFDDGDDPSFAHGWNPPGGVQYAVTDGTIRFNIPQKLNKLCASANGDIICRFDDDDYSAPGRIADQLERLLETGLAVSGYHSMVFIDPEGHCRKYVGDGAYALGTSLMFRKEFWYEHPFKEKKFIGSDNSFVTEAREAHQLISVDPGEMMFARVHDSNTSPKHMKAYHSVSAKECEFVLDVERERIHA